MILALERISGALVRTMEGSEALVRAVVDAAAEHLSAEWVVFALVEGELPDVRPRHLVRGPHGETPEHVRHHVDQVRAAAPTATTTRTRPATTCTCPSGSTGASSAGSPRGRPTSGRSRTPTTPCCASWPVRRLRRCRTAALLDHSARLHARTARQAADLKARNTELVATQAELGAARQREVLDDERHRIARELHDSVTQYALSAGMHIELVRSEIDDDRLRKCVSAGSRSHTSRQMMRLSTRRTSSFAPCRMVRRCRG